MQKSRFILRPAEETSLIIIIFHHRHVPVRFLGLGSFHLAFFSLVVVRINPVWDHDELDKDFPVFLCDGVDPLLYPLGVPSEHRWLLLGVPAPVQALPLGQSDLVLVLWTNYAQLAVDVLCVKRVCLETKQVGNMLMQCKFDMVITVILFVSAQQELVGD